MTPRPIRAAGGIAALQGALAIVTAVVLVVRELAGHREDAISGYGTAVWFAIMGCAVAAAGWALWTGRRWGRGIAVFANLILLGVAWYVYSSGQLAFAVVAAAAPITALLLLFSPSGLRWLSQPPSGDVRQGVGDSAASPDNSGPDTR